MSKADKTYAKVANGESDANIRFDDACSMLVKFGWRMRQRGSHTIFTKEEKLLNLQNRDGMVPPYQVRQISEALS